MYLHTNFIGFAWNNISSFVHCLKACFAFIYSKKKFNNLKLNIENIIGDKL